MNQLYIKTSTKTANVEHKYTIKEILISNYKVTFPSNKVAIVLKSTNCINPWKSPIILRNVFIIPGNLKLNLV